MPRKRKPKHPERYTTPEQAARMLEGQAKLLRDQQKPDHCGGHLVCLTLDIRFWYGDEGALMQPPKGENK